jgi:hypothetical protein
VQRLLLQPHEENAASLATRLLLMLKLLLLITSDRDGHGLI